MLKNPFFSVIMPVYNVEKYLEQAIQSILEQNFVNFELIIVEDHSTDNSYEICKRFTSIDSRILLLRTKKNSGAACARNIGLDFIRGEYVTFVDSDDRVDINWLQHIYYYVQKGNIDFLKLGIYEEYFDVQEKLRCQKKCEMKTTVFTGAKYIFQKVVQLEKIPLFGYLFNSVYRADVIKKYYLCFNEAFRVNEDFDFNIHYLPYVKKMQCLSYCGYYYAKRANKNSLSSQNNKEYYLLTIMKIQAFLSYGQKNCILTNDTRQIIFWLYTRIVYSAVMRKIEQGDDVRIFLKEIFASKLYHEFQKIEWQGISKKQKIMIQLLRSRYQGFFLFLVYVIGFVKKHFPLFFIAFKR